ncbi:hypothetical protein E1264_09240 [Actinomadura sp. KC216]|uniref:hypothetical protein n=1 Tax=Actinomadura sp. KC216 TaxID=2530370 RepID=UPI00104FEB55|nr:hypothetical protein [Actinomadura sp. KC216]TDB89145.1 hypothetical protein E1264_09240 [Actinomadura sp. KC216]
MSMIYKSQVTEDSPRAVREMLKTLARLAGEREDDAARWATTLNDAESKHQRSRTTDTWKRLNDEARIARSKADTARHLLIQAWLAAGYDDEGRRWISYTEAERFADAMIKVALAERCTSGLSLDLDDVFTGRIEVN